MTTPRSAGGPRHRIHTVLAAALGLMLGAGLVTAAGAQPAAAPAEARSALRVCMDPNNLPFSSVDGQGIENRIAEIFGRALGLPVTYYTFPNRMAFIRNTLRYKLPGADYPCDVVLGVPVGFDQVAVTRPYYRSTHAMVFAPGRAGLDGVRTPEDLLALPPATLKALRIGVYDRSPASQWLVRHGLVDNGVPYNMLSPDPQQYPGEIIERDLVAGRIDLAIVWGPIGGYFAHRVKEPQLRVLPMASEPGVKLDFEMAMGVRHGERDWKQQIEGLIDSRRGEIEAVLRDYQVPLLPLSAPLAQARP
ncbi:quinoprotein dehydrogenase-associated putative ABC transporter substrate-binding protein [Pseudaquabacterium rugosum]|uniref:Quinoprotein dehydrogenase-associated putative ABC transporter substrate-binding protein n=1 Tax=Pseudaquabacterium rugosum TaxID=2984194 RepID=A0ABU9B8T8_9BURK